MAQAQPVVGLIRLALVRQVGLLAVAHIKQIAQHLYAVALLAFAEQGAHRHIQVLAQQVEQGAFHGRDGVDGRAQVKGLLAPAAAVAVGKLLAHGLQHSVVMANRLTFDQGAGVFQRLADFFAAGHFAQACVARRVGQDDDVAGEKRAVGTTEVHQHAVMACHGNHLHAGDGGGVMGSHGVKGLVNRHRTT